MAVPVVLGLVLEVVHVAADVLIRRVISLSLLSDAEVNKVACVFHDKLALGERPGCDDPATFARNIHHLQHRTERFTGLTVGLVTGTAADKKIIRTVLCRIVYYNTAQ